MARRQLTFEYDDETLSVTGSFDGDFIDQVSQMFEHLFDRGLVRLTVFQSHAYTDRILDSPVVTSQLTAKVERRRDRNQSQLELRMQ